MFLHLSVSHSVHRGNVSQHALRHAPPRTDSPGQAPPLPQQTATAADGTHPNGMHSCFILCFYTWYNQHELNDDFSYDKQWPHVVTAVEFYQFLVHILHP